MRQMLSTIIKTHSLIHLDLALLYKCKRKLLIGGFSRRIRKCHSCLLPEEKSIQARTTLQGKIRIKVVGERGRIWTRISRTDAISSSNKLKSTPRLCLIEWKKLNKDKLLLKRTICKNWKDLSYI